MRSLFRTRGPRRLLAQFLVAALVPSAALVWLGWQLVEQDRRLERQRLQDGLENTATSLTATIERELYSLYRELPSLLLAPAASLPSETAIAIRVTKTEVVASVGAPLLYRPSTTSAIPEPPDAFWSDGERLEFLQKDLAGANRAYRSLARSANPNARAGALLRLARVLKKSGRHDEALDVYSALAELPAATINGDPADLVARWARLDLLDRLERHGVLRAEAGQLAGDLDCGRWVIDRTTYLTYSEAVARWMGASTVLSARSALTEAVVTGWNEWRARSSNAAGNGRRSVQTGTTETLLIWRDEGDSLLLFAATSEYLTEAWRRLWPGSDIAVTFVGDRGNVVLGGTQVASVVPPVVKHASETGLPWTLRVSATSRPAGSTASALARRRVLLAGLALLTFLLPATGYLVARAVQRESAVAKQQADFVAAVSHEFRSPLTALAHLTSILRSDIPISEGRRRQYYEVLSHETDRLKRFVETLLDFGRMQAGAARYRQAPIQLEPFITSLVAEFRNDPAAATHPVSVSSCGPHSAVAADPEALGRAIWNLLENAAKYSADGSPILVRLEPNEGWVAVRVIDRGVGIPKDEQPHVFERFFRGAAASQSAVKGTGVGLAMAAYIVRAHGGEIRLESKPGAGKHVQHFAAHDYTSPDRVIGACVVSKRLLIVEDEPGIAMALEDELTHLGYDIEVARDGETAVEEGRDARFDAIVLDVMLPKKDGFEVCRELRRMGVRTPILMLTAKAQEHDKVHGLEIGADDYVTKPYSPLELCARIHALLRRSAEQLPDIYRFGDVAIDFSRRDVTRKGVPLLLTPLEFRLLEVFIRHRGQALGRQRLIDAAWGRDTFVTDRVVDNQVTNLRKKIEPYPSVPRARTERAWIRVSIRRMNFDADQTMMTPWRDLDGWAATVHGRRKT